MTALQEAKAPAAKHSPPAVLSTLEEERRAVLDGILQSLGTAAPDDDQLAACRYLLRHLARTAPLRCTLGV